jgi:AraC-like DNA-binding protein
MEIEFSFITLIYIAGVVLGLVSGIVILFFALRQNLKNLPLGIGQISLALAIWVSLSIVSGLIVYWPYMYRTGNIFALIFVPMPFLYARFYYQNRTWKWKDLIHTIPVVLYVVDFSGVLFLPLNEKRQLILQEIGDPYVFMQLGQSRFFAPGFHPMLRTAAFAGYWIVLILDLLKWRRKNPELSRGQKIWRSRMAVFLFFQFFLWFPSFLSLFWLDKSLSFHLVHTSAASWLVLLSVSLFFYPDILYGQHLGVKRSASGKSGTVRILPSARTADPEYPKLADIMRTIDQKMEQEKLFLNLRYSINDFSGDSGLPVYQISKCLNHLHNMSFIDYINQKRIRYCVEIIDSGGWKNFTLEAIAQECGFNNRNSFTKAFQKILGVAPSEYRSR